jgi:hypothetical protein
MPYQKPQPAATSLDKALDEIQNKEPTVTEAPQQVAPQPEPMPEAAAPVVEEPKVVEEPPAPPAPPPPVPGTRVVVVQPDTSFFGLSVGMYNPFSHRKGAALNLEWQPGVRIVGVIQPLFGGMVTTRGGVMGYGGLGVPIKLSEHFMFMPSLGAGAYNEGSGEDLHRTFVYRGAAELAYVFDDQSRLGLNLQLISNGRSFHPHDRSEVIGLVYTMPFNLLSGGK